MTIEEIHEELERRGEEKAETTVYHHVNVLKDAGMVEISRLEEADGGTRKYYRSNTQVFSYTLPGAVKRRSPQHRRLRRRNCPASSKRSTSSMGMTSTLLSTT